MKMKKCGRCKETKTTSDFYKHKRTKDGYAWECKDCVKKSPAYHSRKFRPWLTKYDSQRKKTDFKFFVEAMYKNMYCRVKNYDKKHSNYEGLNLCSITEFKQFALNNEVLKEQYRNWQLSSYKYHLIPTPDRIDNKIGYLLENIRFLPFIENCRRPKPR